MTDILKINRDGPANLNPEDDWTRINPAESFTLAPSGNFFEFQEVSKSFDDRLVLDHVSFSVKRAETCVIMGRSGVGKSVSLNHIMGFL